MPCNSAASSPSSGSICWVWLAPLVWNLRANLPSVLGPLDDRVDLLGRSADHRLRRRGVDAHLEVGIVGEHRLDLFGGVLDERHQPDVLAEQHRLALTHQVRARADGAGGVGQRQAAREVGRRGLAERLANHRTGFRAVRLEQLTERDLDREDGDLRGLDAVVLRVVEDQLDDRVAELVLDQRVDLVDPLGERSRRADTGSWPSCGAAHRNRPAPTPARW